MTVEEKKDLGCSGYDEDPRDGERCDCPNCGGPSFRAEWKAQLCEECEEGEEEQ